MTYFNPLAARARMLATNWRFSIFSKGNFTTSDEATVTNMIRTQRQVIIGVLKWYTYFGRTVILVTKIYWASPVQYYGSTPQDNTVLNPFSRLLFRKHYPYIKIDLDDFLSLQWLQYDYYCQSRAQLQQELEEEVAQ